MLFKIVLFGFFAAHLLVTRRQRISTFIRTTINPISLHTSSVEAAVAMDRAEDHLSKNLQRFIKRDEQWHGSSNR